LIILYKKTQDGHYLVRSSTTKNTLKKTAKLIKKKSIEYLEHISQKRFFIKIISAYKDEGALVCQGFTTSAISDFS
jgi:hypothetical protein